MTINGLYTLHPGNWYAAEFIGDEFNADCCAYSPIRVETILPLKSGRGLFRLKFHHASYPEGVQDKEYLLQTIERGSRFLLARSQSHQPPRLVQLYDIDWGWLRSHFDIEQQGGVCVSTWLERNL